VAGNSETIKVTLDLDAKEFIKKMKEATGLVGELGQTESVGNLASTFIKIGTVAGIAAGAILAVKSALDLAEAAEHIRQVNRSFEAMAESAGVSADVIKNQLVKAVGGLADDTDIIKSATKAMASLGENSAKAGDIMELARKTTKAFGGDLLDNFEKISQALASGQTRMLRQYGIIVDTDKAQKDYAKSIGTSVEFLTDAAKRQAIMNAALEQGREKFKGISLDTNNATDNLKKIGVSLSEIKEAAILAWDKLAGPTVNKAISAVSEAVHGLAIRMKATFGEGQEKEEARRQVLEGEVDALKKQAELYEKIQDKSQLAITNDFLKAKLEQLEKINDEDEDSMRRDLKREAREFKPGDAAAAPEAKPQIDYEKLKESQLKFEADILQIRQNRITSEEPIAQSEFEADQIRKAQEAELYRQAEEQKLQIKMEYFNKGIITEQQYAEAQEQINLTTNNKIAALEQQTEARRLSALENAANQAKTVSQGISAGWAVEAQKASMASKNFGNMGKVVFGSLKKNAVSAFEAIGDGSKSAGEAMKGFMFGAIADIAQAQGEVMLASGIGKMNPLEIAQGGVLIALASALRSMAGGKGSTFEGGAGGGGGGAGAAEAPEAAKPEAVEKRKKEVTVNIQGSYYETEQTRTRLMDMIRESGDFTDFNLKQIGQP
jgi:hypothetical protein